MKLYILSGRSGSGKSTALRALEDVGFNCIDNFPVSLLQSLVHNAVRDPLKRSDKTAVCIDARSTALERFPEILLSLDRMDLDIQLIYLDARSPELVKRFSETRRRHPLTNDNTDLRQALDAEQAVLENIADLADLNIDTTTMAASALVELIKSRVAERVGDELSLLFRSFGFKYGVPVDADMVFDIRCLPNPYWDEDLRGFTGLDAPVERFLSKQDDVNDMFNDIRTFLERWIPSFEANNRVYITVAIGCTGGQHRSVYMSERLGAHFESDRENVLVRHRELNRR